MNWHKYFQFTISDADIFLSSNFDSGNLYEATLLPTMELELKPGFDIISYYGSIKPTSKTFFHFRLTTTKPITIKFRICRVKILKHLYEDGEVNQYRLCFKRKREKEYRRYEQQPELIKENYELQLLFSYSFQYKDDVYFALSYPYGYVKMIELVRRLDAEFKNDADVYFMREVLVYSLEGRQVPMLTISSHDGKTNIFEERISNSMFPEVILDNRPNKFRKPVIIITSRVHPGYTPSSFAVYGILEFLLNKKDLRSNILRRMFTFLIVPMLNPDGVFMGMYRMDSHGQNLNRFYNSAQSHKQPAIFAMRSLFNYYEKYKKMYGYFDIHGHSRRKGTFFYGNASNEYTQQVESKLFSKIMSLNCSHFQYDLCNYSLAQMTFKDINEMLSKEGCGRVVAYRTTLITHSYTMELGFHNGDIEQLAEENNKHFRCPDGYCVNWNRSAQKYFTPECYKEAGRAMLISLLDSLELNPYTRLQSYKANQNYKAKTIASLRQQIARYIYDKYDRFKMLDPNLLKKYKNINQIAQYNIRNYLVTKFAGLVREYVVKQPEERKEEEGKYAYCSINDIESKSTSINNVMEFVGEETVVMAAGKSEAPTIFKTKIKNLRKLRESLTINQEMPPLQKKPECVAVKLLKLSFEPFVKFYRKYLVSFVRKQHSPFRDESIRYSINLPSIGRTADNTGRTADTMQKRRTSLDDRSDKMPFSIYLRLRKNFEMKYGIRDSLQYADN